MPILGWAAGRHRERPSFLLALLTALLFLLFLPGSTVAEDSGDPLNEMRDSCLEKCAKDKDEDSRCPKYCACHLDAIREGLTNDEIRRMLELAASNEPGAERIRLWLFGAAVECHKKIFGEGPTSLQR